MSLPPPVGGKTPDGKDAWKELADGGVSFVRTGRVNWDAQQIDAQIAAEKKLEDAAAAHGFLPWLWLGDLPNLPTTAGSPKEHLLTTVVDGFKANPGLGAYKGIDEPQHSGIPTAGLVRAHTKLRARPRPRRTRCRRRSAPGSKSSGRSTSRTAPSATGSGRTTPHVYRFGL